MPRVPRYLRQRTTGRVYVHTDELAKRADMVLHTAQPDVGAEERSTAQAAPEPEPDEVAPAKRISHMNKDELEAYAMFHFGIEIDKRKRLVDLRLEVQAMASEAVPE